MPQVGNTKGHTFGQAYARAKAGKSTEVHDEPDGDEGESGDGSEMHVKHMGGGKFKTKSKHHDGHVTKEQHESPEELHAHMAQHFGTGGGESEQMGSMPEEGVGSAVKSILG
jgi:hypothetical protein